MDTNYEPYKVFCHVTVMLDFSKAPKRFFTSQSTVSQPAKVLGKKFNQPLFIRNTKKVQLTPKGEILLKHIEPAMSLIREGENQLLETHTLNGGQLRTRASDTTCRYYLVPYLNRLHKEFPDIHIKVVSQTSVECAKFLEDGQVDFIVASYPDSALADSINTRVINKFRGVFVTSRSVSSPGGSRVPPEELLRYPTMMLGRESTTSEFLHQVFQKSQLDLVPETELSSNSLLINPTRIGLGIVFVPDFCIPQNDEEPFILDLKEQLPSRQMTVTYSKSPPVSQAARQFVGVLQEADV